MTERASAHTPRLPQPRGPVSAAVIEALHRPCPGAALAATAAARDDPFGEDGPLGEDPQLSLYVCYELHYRGFRGVDPGWEWDPELLRLRGVLERSFHQELLRGVAGGDDLEGELSTLLVEPKTPGGVSHFLATEGNWPQMREYFTHRSLYQLKEADPQAWVIPRLTGQAKASLVAVEYDEFGGGRGERVHAELFADLMAAAGLDAGYGHYLDNAPATTLAPVNLMSYLGLHRGRRGALVGHFAAAEISNPPNSKRMVHALERLGAAEACRHFYLEHVDADAVHEQVMRHEVLGGLLAAEPQLKQDAVFGIQATELLERRFADHLLRAWLSGGTSLRVPLSG
ncbi:iron-containing redox enzyme family protein [Streptantibioticus rubrisoli]|uniref:Iron-containing redox enzyme family protein n=1 Tax=Streptantibioticus rubrisoli TaxID=1387313 RepID=A0ABT1PBB9_9ACTN|nr:iron-containing redox enzyme family protein [Streptantibioticus rubrisoli]MCQ4042668.1 iron-containing redox enzyme family protein [Streptantibioticus rubrisoli]